MSARAAGICTNMYRQVCFMKFENLLISLESPTRKAESDVLINTYRMCKYATSIYITVSSKWEFVQKENSWLDEVNISVIKRIFSTKRKKYKNYSNYITSQKSVCINSIFQRFSITRRVFRIQNNNRVKKILSLAKFRSAPRLAQSNRFFAKQRRKNGIIKCRLSIHVVASHSSAFSYFCTFAVQTSHHCKSNICDCTHPREAFKLLTGNPDYRGASLS